MQSYYYGVRLQAPRHDFGFALSDLGRCCRILSAERDVTCPFLGPHFRIVKKGNQPGVFCSKRETTMACIWRFSWRKWSCSACVFKADLMGFVDLLDKQCERNRGIDDDAKLFGPRS